MDHDPTTRTLALLTLLQSGGEWTAADLAGRLGTSTRTVRRDAQRLRRLGYAVEARPGPGSTYRLRPGVRMPPLLFTADEITALVAGLHLIRAWLPEDAVASSALVKLDQVLPRPLRRRAAATDLATEVLQQPGAVVAAATVGVIADAVAEGGRLRFRYTDQHDRRTTRLVEPYRHFLRAGAWYLVAFDVDRDDWRTFRLDRIADITPVAGAFPPRPFPDASIEHWLTTDFGRAAAERPSDAAPGAPRGASEPTEPAEPAETREPAQPAEPTE
ncbi:WYL domain-containing protein [Streptomyces sp. 71268]|uniref:helix-turn-helix transcriptional regulator n=1 Tax=Streptomyces sp. 71268 TaxID=3002640 RepID=UPI0023F93FCD|nr:WYL domain-containing protein [Streptomyces sp. 71268]WEV28170.1 WYL domain-containing protein [Streptomyces sp. 71268]